MLAHYQQKLKEAIATSRALSDQVSDLLKQGATLDDERIVALSKKRALAYEDVDDFEQAVRQEKQAASRKEIDHHMKATNNAETLELRERLRELESDLARSDEEDLRQIGTMIYGGGRGDSGWRPPRTPETMTRRGGGGPRPFQTFGEQLQAVYAAAQPGQVTMDKGLAELQQYQLGLGEQVPSEGGFLVQTDFTNELLQRVHITGKLNDRPKTIQISGRANGLKMNAIDEESRVDGSRMGGIQGYWIPEAGTITKSKPTFRQIELTLHKLAGLYYATDEELADTVALEETIADAFAEEFGFKLDDALIRGTGAGEPLGILGHAGTVSVAKEGSQAAKTIVIENLEKMYARLWARARDPVWLVNQDCWPQLFDLSKAVGVGGVPVFLPAGSVSGKPFQTLFGWEIISLEQCETLGTKGDIILADFPTGYVMIDKGGIDAAVSIHVEFLTDQSVFRFILRTDGQPIANVPLTPYKGTDKVSSFVTLDSRA